VRRQDCVGVEDAQAGIEAIRRADMKAIGIGSLLAGADLIVGGLDMLSTDRIVGMFAPGNSGQK